jgi:hypothetical protein
MMPEGSISVPRGTIDLIVETASGQRLVEGKDYVFDREQGTLTMHGVTLRETVVRLHAPERRYSIVLVPRMKREAQWKRETNRRFR